MPRDYFSSQVSCCFCRFNLLNFTGIDESKTLTQCFREPRVSVITQAQIKEVTKRIVENYRPEKVILFGSYAKGNPTVDSDLDLLVIKNSHLPRYKRGSEIRKHLRGMKIPIDLVVYTNEEIARWRDVKMAFITTAIETGVVLYEEQR
jgi:predicted nucleotidyltransferase